MLTPEELMLAYPDLYGDWTFGFSFPRGWTSIVADLSRDLSGKGIKVVQVKSKFGGLRYYIRLRTGTTDDEARGIYERISIAEEKSFRTCENCGNTPASERVSGGWISTLCSDCGGPAAA